MKGVRAWSFKEFHPNCKDIEVVDIAGFAHIFCHRCRVLINMEAISPKYEEYNTPRKSDEKRIEPKRMLEVGE